MSIVFLRSFSEIWLIDWLVRLHVVCRALFVGSVFVHVGRHVGKLLGRNDEPIRLGARGESRREPQASVILRRSWDGRNPKCDYSLIKAPGCVFFFRSTPFWLALKGHQKKTTLLGGNSSILRQTQNYQPVPVCVPLH